MAGGRGMTSGSWGWAALHRSRRAPLELLLGLCLLLVGCAYAVFFCASTRDISGHALGTDDAYISYRYARNWVAGHGLVFNPGDAVEGYTNLLYVVLMAVPMLLGWDVYAFSAGFNTLCALGMLLVFWRFIRERLGDRLATIGAFLLALSPSLWIWVSSGLETALVVFLQLSIWVLLERVVAHHSRRSFALLALAASALILTRADGFVTALVASGYLALRSRLKLAGLLTAGILVTVGAVFAWRFAYYNELWPNTYYAKVSSTLARRLASSSRELLGIGARQGLLVYLVVIFSSAVAVALRLVRERKLDSLRFDQVFPPIWVAYWLYVGGDIFEDRFLVILIPYGIFQLLGLLAEASSLAVRQVVVALACLVPLSVPIREAQYGRGLGPKYDRWITLGRFLGKNYVGKVLATSAAGKIPFFSGLPTIDMLGLTDRYIARLDRHQFAVGHSKFDPDYVLSRRPDLIAAWLVDDALDFDSGMQSKKYRPAGYVVRLLVNSTPTSSGAKDIIDVLGCSDERIALLAHRGWNFGVLEHTASLRSTSGARCDAALATQ
jgi:arabinofuranosyltransferase